MYSQQLVQTVVTPLGICAQKQTIMHDVVLFLANTATIRTGHIVMKKMDGAVAQSLTILNKLIRLMIMIVIFQIAAHLHKIQCKMCVQSILIADVVLIMDINTVLIDTGHIVMKTMDGVDILTLI